MRYRKLGMLLAALATAATVLVASASGSSGPPVIQDSQLQALTTTEGGATVLPTTRTIPHWFGQTLDPQNGVTYGYNMVGADPNSCSGTGCDVTIEADITPIVVNVAGRTFDGRDVLAATLDSPQFAPTDFGSTGAATNDAFKKGAGGALSQGDDGIPLQLQDATMRAQFDKTGAASNYHLRLHPNVLSPVTINVPSNQGTVIASGRGVLAADINISWWSAQIQNLETKADPTHLPIYLTDNVMLHIGPNIFNCCVIGYHGTRAAGNGAGNTNSNGNAPVQTFAWASYVRPGFYARPNGGLYWALQDIHALSHEIAEWADDPFVNNWVDPWVTPTAPQYGCTGILETGDPVVGIGFSAGTNPYLQTGNPWTSPTDHTPSVSYDGTYHPEDEVFLPWFMRLPSNATGSEANQSSSGGRYTFMGDLNPFPGFRAPATGC